MADNSQKTPLARSLNRFAEQKVLDAIQTLGKSLPCHVVAVMGSIVRVQFDVTGPFTLPQVTCPMMGPQYIRYPTQVGDKGFTAAADYYLGGVSGLGGGVANLSLPANLSALVFCPIANATWSATDDPNAIILYGPNGGVLRTVDMKNSITVSKQGITIKSDSKIFLTAPQVVAPALAHPGSM